VCVSVLWVIFKWPIHLLALANHSYTYRPYYVSCCWNGQSALIAWAMHCSRLDCIGWCSVASGLWVIFKLAYMLYALANCSYTYQLIQVCGMGYEYFQIGPYMSLFWPLIHICIGHIMCHVVGTANQLTLLEPCITNVCIALADLSVHLGYESFLSWPYTLYCFGQSFNMYWLTQVCVWPLMFCPRRYMRRMANQFLLLELAITHITLSQLIRI